MKHICLDTETTGFDPRKGDRIVEIACVELENYMPTGREYHQYINPERDMPEAAYKVHGLSADFLSDYPVFSKVAQDFVDFIGDIPLVIHNAKFDMKFLNFELMKCGYDEMPMSRSIDSLAIARKKFPGSPATLDALCKRFDISLQSRDLHGALIDTRLLAEVYLNLCEGRAPKLTLETDQKSSRSFIAKNQTLVTERQKDLPTRLKEDEIKAHKAFISKFKSKSLWDN